MDCAEEIRALRRTVGRLPGVSDLRVDLLAGTMTVLTPPDRPATDEEILSAVRAAGLEASPAGGADTERGGSFARRRGRLVLCAASFAFLVAGFCVHVTLHGSVAHALAGYERGAETEFPPAAVILFSLATLAGVIPVLPKAWSAARRARPDMNLLMTLAIGGAIAIGQWLEAATVAFLFALALLLESWSADRARRAIRSLMSLAPATARVVDPQDRRAEQRNVEDVPIGAAVLVRPGERIPLDGTVLEGSTLVDQSPITGESQPVERGPGEEVLAGSINDTGAITLRVTKPARDTTIARVIRMVEEARARRAPSEQWVDLFARYYTPFMMILAALVAVIPPLVFGASWTRWFYDGLVLLVIACPCALVISTPVTVVAGLARAARAGVLIKGGVHLETPARLRALALDKTGTLTHGRPEVQQVIPLNGHTESELVALAAGLEAFSEHPLARAIRRRAERDGIAAERFSDFREIKGRGAEAARQGVVFWIGSHRLLHERGLETPEIHARAGALEDAGHSVVALGNERHVCGLLSVADRLRPEAFQAVLDLKRRGIRSLVMLTGDNEGTARRIAEAVGISDFRAELLPEEKVRAMEALVRAAGTAGMVGDGVNDAPALAAASVGIAMGAAGSDAAIETADIALMSDDLARLPWLILHSRRTLRVIRQNTAFALGTKLVFVSLAAAGAATLWMAIAADMGASLLVILNGLRVLRD